VSYNGVGFINLLLTGYIYFKWHTETGNTVIPPEEEAIFFYIIFKNRYSYISQILVKEGFQINARLFTEKVFYLGTFTT
jgi:hypothetical protein